MNGLEVTNWNNNIFTQLGKNWLKTDSNASTILKVAGIAYYQLHTIYHHLTPGIQLKIQREYNNEHDKNAIAVYYRNFKLGYLPEFQNSTFANQLDNGKQFAVKVFTSVKDKYLPTDELYIEIDELD